MQGRRSPERKKSASRYGSSPERKSREFDKFNTILSEKLEDVQTYCGHEVSRLTREVSGLQAENAELRHDMAKLKEESQLDRMHQTDGSNSPDSQQEDHQGIAKKSVSPFSKRWEILSRPIGRPKVDPDSTEKYKEEPLSPPERRILRSRSAFQPVTPSTSGSPSMLEAPRDTQRHASSPSRSSSRAQSMPMQVTFQKPQEEDSEKEVEPPALLTGSEEPSAATLSTEVTIAEAAARAAELVQGASPQSVSFRASGRFRPEQNSSALGSDDEEGNNEISEKPWAEKFSTNSSFLSIPSTRTSLHDPPGRLSAVSRHSARRSVPEMRQSLSRNTRDSFCRSEFAFEPLPHWTLIQSKKHRFAKGRQSRMSDSFSLSQTSCMTARGSLDDPLDHPHRPKKSKRVLEKFIEKHLMSGPTTVRCIAFDMVGVVLIVYELIFLPMQVFDVPKHLVFQIIDWIQRIFWTFAIVRSFTVGYMLKDGTVELRPRKVAKQYVCGWFTFDVFVALFDWIEVIMAGYEFVSAARVTKTIRFARIVRILRLARMAKLPRILEEFDARFISERTLLLLSIVKIALLFTVVNHMIACLWYGLGRYMGYDNRSWVIETSVVHESTAYQYTTSLHWALTQFQGSMEVMPQNTYERNYAVVVLVFTFVAASVFVSRITAAYTRLQIIAGGNERKFAQLRMFLQSRDITSSLAMRVMRSAQFAVNQSTIKTQEKDIELLKLITEPLQIEIHYEIFRPHLVAHPLLLWIDSAYVGAMRHLCHSAIHLLAVSQGDLLFSEGEEPINPRMLFVMSGSLTYNCELEETVVGKGTWFSEGTLWMPWVHVGDLAATSEGQIVAMKADCFQDTMVKFFELAEVLSKYAVNFADACNTCHTMLCDLHRGCSIEELLRDACKNTRYAKRTKTDLTEGGKSRTSTGNENPEKNWRSHIANTLSRVSLAPAHVGKTTSSGARSNHSWDSPKSWWKWSLGFRSKTMDSELGLSPVLQQEEYQTNRTTSPDNLRPGSHLSRGSMQPPSSSASMQPPSSSASMQPPSSRASAISTASKHSAQLKGTHSPPDLLPSASQPSGQLEAIPSCSMENETTQSDQ